MALKIDVKPPHGQPELQLRGVKRVLEWAKGEMAFWETLEPARPEWPQWPITSWTHVRRDLSQIVKLAQDRPEGWEGQLPERVSQVVGRLRLLSRDPRAKYLQGLLSSGVPGSAVADTFAAICAPREFHSALRHREPQQPNRSVRFSQAIARATLSEYVSTQKAFADVRGSVRALVSETDSALERQQQAVRRIEKSTSGLARRWRHRLRRQREILRSSSDAFVREQEQMRERFENELSLRGPTDYWAAKAKAHDEEAAHYRKVFLGAFAGGLIALAVIAAKFLIPYMQGHDEWWPVVLYSGLVAVWAWPLRIASKLYLAHRNLHEDASERETIARTFLALGESVNFTEPERQLLLAALFRPAHSGLVKDDGNVTGWDLFVSRALGGGP